MPMIDVYATTGTFVEKHALAQNLAAAVMRWEQVPDLALFRNNTAAFVHELPPVRSRTSTAKATTCACRSSHPSACSTGTSSLGW